MSMIAMSDIFCCVVVDRPCVCYVHQQNVMWATSGLFRVIKYVLKHPEVSLLKNYNISHFPLFLLRL
jgi:hypothetical protein